MTGNADVNVDFKVIYAPLESSIFLLELRFFLLLL